MKKTIEVTEQELKDLKLIRNYFGKHDKTQIEHLAYSELDKLVKKLQQADVMRSVCCGEKLIEFKTYGYNECPECGKTYKQTDA